MPILRKKICVNSWGGMTTLVMSSSSRMAVTLVLMMKSSTFIRRWPSTLWSTTSASSRISGWGISPLGEALPMLPPMVALFRRAIAPMREAASFRSGWVTGEV